MNKTDKFTNENAEKILQTAWILFQRKGFRGVSMDELCLQCQITKPTLYYYFKDKEDLFVRVLVYKLEGMRPALQTEGSLEQRLTRYAACLLDNFQTEYTGLVHDREHIHKSENQERIRTAFRSEMFDPMIALLQSGIDEGALVKEDPHSLALMFLGIVNNFIGKAEGMGLSSTLLAEKLTNYFIKGVKKRE
jgi:AcrR family transcriptional regulator